MLKTSEEAREYFKPLTYKDLTEISFKQLVAFLEGHLGEWNRKVLIDRAKNNHDNRYYMTIHPHKKYSKYPGTRYEKDKAFIIVKCDNYSFREGISFNKDGFIGFAGWSDKDNVRPFLDAFEEWVAFIKATKYNFNELEQKLFGGYTYLGIVKDSPENPNNLDFVIKDGKRYMYLDEWTELDFRSNEQILFENIYNTVEKASNSKLKREIKQLIEKYQEDNQCLLS